MTSLSSPALKQEADARTVVRASGQEEGRTLLYQYNSKGGGGGQGAEGGGQGAEGGGKEVATKSCRGGKGQ